MEAIRNIPTTVYNLEWICPHCKEKNKEFYFTNWEYKTKFWCGNCHKVAWRKPSKT